jgi:trk system potassium uptake protein
MNKRLVVYLWGKIALVFGGYMLFPLLMTLVTNENRLAEFGIPVLISVAIGAVLTRGINPYKGRLSVREGILLISGAFVFLCILGMFPFWLTGFSFIDSLFESVSGFTTTGASVLGDLDVLPRELLLWRSLTQWLGGLGIIIVFVTMVPQVGREALQLFTGELHGESAERLLPRITETMKLLFCFYSGFTCVVTLLLLMAGMDFFEAINHAMAIVSTGGFSVYNDGLRHFNSTKINFVVLVCMFMAGGNHVLYFKTYREGLGHLFKDTEFRLYMLLTAIFGIFIAVDLYNNNLYGAGSSIFNAFFQTVSTVSTSGFAMANYDAWPDFSKYCLFLLMFVGGCSGSTVGGIKMSRMVILLKVTGAELKRTIHPRMVTTISMTGRVVSPRLIDGITRFFFLYITIFFFSASLLALVGDLSMFSAAGIAAACLASVGAAFETVASIAGYAELNNGAKVIAMLTMLLGRLEIFTLLVLFHPDFWKTE